ncbi:hypothetical protein FRACYDRAFT_247264 [Fragilariopsis cylindrus CCMP1102]|uniref:Ankyrin n=1 Tax=Fragilariopsis cylindrus CCMP1102 TaxID=635003 RepID=A0A1E7EWU3_9STRA|nr:hypothetical protein FRACYDRAFT_247264 [Fragilariopsis cylindrus CCMP1102]|eukprot:OEU10309.1 hypothetical protein FRACYDRAFT_247264 [Fragilariopsis cylindrus CCMP1102]
MDDNIDNEVDEDQLEADAAATAAADAAEAEAAEQRHLKIMSVLQQKKKLPLETRNEIDGLIEEFLVKVKSNIQSVICSNELENYHGLDSDRDTDQEVETAIRLFPKVLATKKSILWHDDYDERIEYYYPVQLLIFSHSGGERGSQLGVKELGVFGVMFGEQFGGELLIKDNGGDNILQNLMSRDQTRPHSLKYHETVDSKYLQVLVQLRKMGVFKKEDIQRYDLLDGLCGYHNCFPDMRFRFLVEWDPSSLIWTGRSSLNWLPLHHAAYKSSIRGFRSVFEAGIKYFPNKKGISLLFHRNGYTPFQMACRRFGYKEVMKVVEETLIRYSDTSINTTEALITAAIDEDIHLDCAYFLLRREPDILHKLLLSTQAAVMAMTIDSSTNEATSDKCDPEKRKRKRGT